MKIHNALVLFLLSSTVSLTPVVASADPGGINITIICPNVQNKEDMLSNYGDYIAGYGVKQIIFEPNLPIYFKSSASTARVPVDLQPYVNAWVKYNSSTGSISCSYVSNLGEPSFDMAYTLTNGKGGKITRVDNDRIFILIPFGRLQT
jgi:hypothetical protein